MSEDALQSKRLSNQTAEGALDITVRHVIDPERRIVFVTFGRKLTLQDIQAYTQRLLSSSSFDPSFSEIVDLTQVEKVALQADDFLKLADHVDPFSAQAKRAFVARNSVQNHAARMHKVLGTERTIEIFRSMEEAERWIRSLP